MRNYSAVGPGLSGARRRHRRRGRVAWPAVAATAAGVVALGVAASPAGAAPLAWGYQQITPADSSATPINGVGVSEDASTVVARTRLVPIPGMPEDGRSGYYTYGLSTVGAPPWTFGVVDARNGNQITTLLRGLSPDGSRALYDRDGLRRVDAQGGEELLAPTALSPSIVAPSRDLDVVAFRGTRAGSPVYLSVPGKAPVVVSVDNDGAAMTATGLGTSSAAGLGALRPDNALSADGSSVIFTSTSAIPGDNDGGKQDLYRRVLTPGAEQTILISDATTGAGADAPVDASYRWATADHRRVFFVTAESLEPGDTDGEQDLYVRDGTSAPVRVSQGETVDGSPTGNGTSGVKPDWVMSSADGNRTFFITSERLTQDAPAGGDRKLYERDLAEGRTRFVALITGQEASGFLGGGSSGPLRVTPNGAVFLSNVPLSGEPTINTPTKVFVWTRDGGPPVPVSKPAADAPPGPTQNATFFSPNVSDNQQNELIPFLVGRGMSDDGSRVFFGTRQSLTADDTDGGYLDVYSWTADEGVRLVTPPGREPYDAGYLDNSPDGTKVYFNTNETVLPGDTDPNAADVYVAILGGGAAPGKPGPDADAQVCTGDGCQGPLPGPLALPGLGSVGLVGSGNVLSPPAPSEASLTVVKPKVASGTKATLRVKVSERGRVRVSGSGLARTTKTAKKAGTVRLSVKLSKRARRTLKRKHRVRVRATVRLTPREGRSVRKRVHVTFKQAKAKHGKKAPARAATKKGGR